MAKKNVVITGASDGIGKAGAEDLDRKNYNLFIVGHNKRKTAHVAMDIGAKYFTVDFANLDTVKKLAKQIKKVLGDAPLNILVNNAGGSFSKKTTIDGFNKTFQVNHLGPFLLTNLLLPRLLKGQGAVINTSSVANLFGHLNINNLNYKKKFSPHKAYSDTKLENILMAKELHRRYHHQGLSAVAFHPGNIASNFGNDPRLKGLGSIVRHSFLNNLLTDSQKAGKLLDWFIGGTPDVTWISGRYYNKYRLTNKINPQANNLNLQKWLWDTSLKLVGLNK